MNVKHVVSLLTPSIPFPIPNLSIICYRILYVTQLVFLFHCIKTVNPVSVERENRIKVEWQITWTKFIFLFWCFHFYVYPRREFGKLVKLKICIFTSRIRFSNFLTPKIRIGIPYPYLISYGHARAQNGLLNFRKLSVRPSHFHSLASIFLVIIMCIKTFSLNTQQ